MSAERLLVPLSDAEVAKRSQRLAATLVQIADVEEEKAESASSYNEQLKELREIAHELALDVHRRAEERVVEVDEIRNLEAGSVDTVRKDTSEVIRSRPLTETEAQVTIEDLRERREQQNAHTEGPSGEIRQAVVAGGSSEPPVVSPPNEGNRRAITQIIATTPEMQRVLDEVAAEAEPVEIDGGAPEPEAFEVD